MAVDAHFPVAVEIVKDHILLRQGVLIGRDLLAEDSERRIAVSLGQIAELLIVGAILFDDVDDVLDLGGYPNLARNNRGLKRGTRLGEQRIVIRSIFGHLFGPLRQLLLQSGDGQYVETSIINGGMTINSDLYLRADGPVEGPAWSISPPGLEDLVLAYMSRAADAAGHLHALEAQR